MSHQQIRCAGYLRPIMTGANLKKTVSKLALMLKKHKNDFDAIAFRGLSGSMIAPALAMRMDKGLIAVRKDDASHSCYKVEGAYGDIRYIILDDLIDTGTTVETIIDSIKQNDKEWAGMGRRTFVGIALYRQEYDITEFTRKKVKPLFTVTKYIDEDVA